MTKELSCMLENCQCEDCVDARANFAYLMRIGRKKSKPNLQNIPIRTAEDRRIHKAFVKPMKETK